MRIHGIALGATALCLSAGPLAGQAWDTPLFFPPSPPEEVGLYVTKPEQEDWGFRGIWRQHGNLNLGFHVGLASIERDNNAYLVGAEAYGPLSMAGALDLSWIIGVGATFDSDATWMRIPVGVSLGTRLGSGGLAIVPYVLPRAALDVFAADNADTDTQVNVVTDLGVDVHLTPTLRLRAAYSLWLVEGDLDLANTWGIGAAYDFGRRVAVQ